MGILAGFEESWLSFQVVASLLAGLVAAAVLTIAPYAFKSSRPKGFPDGPPTKPFIGNLHLIPASKSFTVYVPNRSCLKYIRRPLLTSLPDSLSGRRATAPSSDLSSDPPMSLYLTTIKMSKSKQPQDHLLVKSTTSTSHQLRTIGITS